MTSRPTGFPYGVAERADLGFSWHVRKFPGSAGDFQTQLVAQVPEHFLEVGVVGPYAAQVIGELAGLPRGGCTAGPARPGASPWLVGGRRGSVVPEAQVTFPVTPDPVAGRLAQ